MSMSALIVKILRIFLRQSIKLLLAMKMQQDIKILIMTLVALGHPATLQHKEYALINFMKS